jgi:hypothetical protein
MVNHSHESLKCGHWNLYKLVDGQWFHVAPTAHHSDCHTLPAGETERWSLRAFNEDAVPCDRSNRGHDGLTQGYLGGGEYAAVAGYGHPSDESAALVELVGGSVTLVPTEDANSERDGDTVTVTTDRHGDGERPSDATFTLTHVESADSRVIAEQVMTTGGFGSKGRGLRNLLAAASPDGERPAVERVVLRTDAYAFDHELRAEGATRRVQFRGRAFKIACREIADTQ